MTYFDPTQRLTDHVNYKKKTKFTNNKYFGPYPLDLISSRLYGTVKAHKPGKNYSKQTIASTVGTPPHVISRYLVNIVQTVLNKVSLTKLKFFMKTQE